MLIRTNNPGKDFIYPCSKSEVKQVFGEDLFDVACFAYKYGFYRYSDRMAWNGVPLCVASAQRDYGYSITFNRTRKGFYFPVQREQFVLILENEIRPWVEHKRAEPVNGAFRNEKFLIEFVDGGFKRHQF